MTNETCSECSRPVSTRGWCKSHYDAWLRTGDPKSYRGDRSSVPLWDKLQEIGWTRNAATGCNEWNGYRNELGYGQFRPGHGPLVRVHRIVYAQLVGQLAENEQVLHSCDNPSCSEPSHLMKGKAVANMQDMRSKRRGYKDRWTHCPNGHEYPEDAPPKWNKNRCRECARERNRRYEARCKEASRAHR